MLSLLAKGMLETKNKFELPKSFAYFEIIYFQFEELRHGVHLQGLRQEDRHGHLHTNDHARPRQGAF